MYVTVVEQMLQTGLPKLPVKVEGPVVTVDLFPCHLRRWITRNVMKEINTVGVERDENWLFSMRNAVTDLRTLFSKWLVSEENGEEAPMRRSFSVEDLLDEVEKICYDASGTSKVEMVVRLWKDGFTVNEEEFRSYSVPENQDFLDAIKRGELPAEWESRAEKEELEISVEDLTEEHYVPKKKAFHPFSGRGYRLGSVAPRVVARSPSVHEDGESPPIPMVTLDHGLPVTSLQIWLADGRRLVQRFNLSHRITDVQDFVARSQRSCPPFILTTSLPFRELNDKELSLEEADLANAVIVQRPLNTQAPFGHS